MIRNFLLAVLSCFLFSCTDMAENTVRTGKLDSCPSQTVESLINGKVQNAKWENFISKETNEYIVGVRGEISVLNEVSPIHLQFAVDGDRFEIRFLEIDKEAQDIDGTNEFINYLCGLYDQGISEMENTNQPMPDQEVKDADYSADQLIAESNSYDGIYSFEDESCSVSFTLIGDTWQSEFLLKTGLGSDYDSENIEYDGGIVNSNSLFEESGNIEIGHLNGNTLITNISGRSVTLRKTQ